jgi:hypothetical protein
MLEGALEPAAVDNRGEVEEGAGHSSAGDGVDSGDVACLERRRIVYVDAGSAPARSARRCYVYAGAGGWPNAPQGRGRTVRQRGPRPACKYGGHPPTPLRQQRMAERVHTAMNMM